MRISFAHIHLEMSFPIFNSQIKPLILINIYRIHIKQQSLFIMNYKELSSTKKYDGSRFNEL